MNLFRNRSGSLGLNGYFLSFILQAPSFTLIPLFNNFCCSAVSNSYGISPEFDSGETGSGFVRWPLCIIGFYTRRIVTAGSLCADCPNEPPPQVQITPQEGGYLVTTPDYKARIYADGNLHSLIVNGVEMLDDRVAGSAGSAFFVEHPIALPTMTVQERIITASDGTYSVRYDFDEGFITVVLRQTSDEKCGVCDLLHGQYGLRREYQQRHRAAVYGRRPCRP